MANAKAAKPEAEEGQEAAKGGKMKLIIVALAGLLILAGGGGAAAYFLGLFGGKNAAAVPLPDDGTAHANAHDGGHGGDAASAGGDAHGATTTQAAKVAFVELPDMLVNLRSSNKRIRFLKLKVALEVRDEKAAEHVRTFTPRILDGFQLYLRALEVEEVEGSGGMQALKEELMARINQAVAPVRINDVLFKEILVQ